MFFFLYGLGVLLYTSCVPELRSSALLNEYTLFIKKKKGVILFQRKYVLNLLEETSVLGAQPIDVHMSPNHKLLNDGGEFGNSSKYHLLVEKLNYLTITRRDISNACVVGQFLEASRVFTLTCCRTYYS
jgi:hypothetical protein